MNYKWIAFYVSSHGFGHMTRNLAIIEEILEKTNHRIYLASGEYQNDFAKVYLAKYGNRMFYKNICTDIGLINYPGTLEVNKQELEEKLLQFINSWKKEVSKEYQFLSTYDIHSVISDVSPIGALVGKKLKVLNIGIANFTWVEQYKHLGIDKQIVDEFEKAYLNFDLFLIYPLALSLDNLKVKKKTINFITRKINVSKVNEIKHKYGKSIFITCGKSANLKNINVNNFKGTIFTTSGIDIVGSNKVVQLPLNTLDTHNYVAASEIIISKAGWSTISEALNANTKLVLIERDGVLEDSHNIQELKKQNKAISINEESLKNIDILQIEQSIKQNIHLGSKLNIFEDAESIVDILGINNIKL